MIATELEIIRGDDEILDVSFKLPNGVDPLNLTGVQGIWFTAKRSSLDLDVEALLQKSLGAGIAIVNAAAGTATITINAADTAAIAPTTLVWDAQVKDSAGKIRTAAAGRLKIVGDITRAIV